MCHCVMIRFYSMQKSLCAVTKYFICLSYQHTKPGKFFFFFTLKQIK